MANQFISQPIPASIARDRFKAALTLAAQAGLVVRIVDDDQALSAWRALRQATPQVAPFARVVVVATTATIVTPRTLYIGRGALDRSTYADARPLLLAATAVEATVASTRRHRNAGVAILATPADTLLLERMPVRRAAGTRRHLALA